MIHTILNRFTQCHTLPQTRNSHNRLPAVQHSSHTNSQSHPQRGVEVVMGVGENWIICQCFDTCAGDK